MLYLVSEARGFGKEFIWLDSLVTNPFPGLGQAPTLFREVIYL